jgi:hypothetical protein
MALNESGLVPFVHYFFTVSRGNKKGREKEEKALIFFKEVKRRETNCYTKLTQSL